MKDLLLMTMLLGLITAGAADAQNQWQKIHGQVQSVQGTTVTMKADDVRTLTVDASQVGEPLRKALSPGESITMTGFAGPQPNQFTARYIQQESSDVSRGGVVSGRATTGNAQQVASILPQFMASPEFQRANPNMKDPATAAALVTRAYQSFFERPPPAQELQTWQARLAQSGDLGGMLGSFINSPEYAAKKKGFEQGTVDMYQAVLGRVPTQAEVNAWKQRLAQR